MNEPIENKDEVIQYIAIIKKILMYACFFVVGLIFAFGYLYFYGAHITGYKSHGDLYYTSNLTYNGSFYSMQYIFNYSTVDCSLFVYVNSSHTAILSIVPLLSIPSFPKAPYNHLINVTAPYDSCIYQNKT